MKLINIFPLGNLGLHYDQDVHMFLTHLVEKYPFYAKFAKEVKGYKILDNSLIELGGAVSLDRVIAAAHTINADEIILPDVFQNGPATIEVVNEALSELHDLYPEHNWPYKIMAVAQGKDVKEWYECYRDLLDNPDIDVIGIPKVLAKMHPQGRPYFVNELCDLKCKPHHLLGLWYSLTELNEYEHIDDIRSCDTVLLGYMYKHNMNLYNVRPDGYTVDLETDVINYNNYYEDMRDIRRVLNDDSRGE